jgi:hypothetical protein
MQHLHETVQIQPVTNTRRIQEYSNKSVKTENYKALKTFISTKYSMHYGVNASRFTYSTGKLTVHRRGDYLRGRAVLVRCGELLTSALQSCCYWWERLDISRNRVYDIPSRVSSRLLDGMFPYCTISFAASSVENYQKLWPQASLHKIVNYGSIL